MCCYHKKNCVGVLESDMFVNEKHRTTHVLIKFVFYQNECEQKKFFHLTLRVDVCVDSKHVGIHTLEIWYSTNLQNGEYTLYFT